MRSPRAFRLAHLTEFINEMIIDSQLPHKIVNLLFIITYWNNKLTVLWGSWLSKTIELIHSVRQVLRVAAAGVGANPNP